MKRRKFITVSAMSVPLISMFPANLSSITREMRKGVIEKRSLGKTGEKEKNKRDHKVPLECQMVELAVYFCF